MILLQNIIILFFLGKGIGQHYVQYTVNQQLGSDSKKCLQTSLQTPCKTLLYVYKHIILSSYIQVDVSIVGDYHLNTTFQIIDTSLTIKKLRFLGTSSRIIANRSDVAIIVGESHKHKKLGYLVIFERLFFYYFGKHVPAALIIWSNQVHINYCHFDSNNCAAVNALDSIIHIQNSLFQNNTGNAIKKGDVHTNESASFPYGPNSAGGAVAIIFSRTPPTNLSLIDNIFKSNRAVDNTGRFMKQFEGKQLAFSHTGGALLLAFIDDTTGVNMTISNNTFDANRASLGGGIMIALYGNAGYNGITLIDVKLTRNQGSVTGGGFAFGCWNHASANSFTIINSIIAYNGARIGGGGKIIFESMDLNSPDNPSLQFVTFTNVSFFANNAASSSGLHLIYNLPLQWKSVTPVIFQNVTFANHSTFSIEADQDGYSAFSGVLLSNRVDIRFEKSNVFVNNTSESPLYVSNTALRLKGNLSFLSNHVPTSGAGITLTDVSHLYLYSGSSLLFQDNFARVQGGAMFVRTVGFPDMVYKYNPSCFIQYHIPNIQPSQWNVTVRFIRNGAGLKGAAIFANTITSCIWNEQPPYYFSFAKALRWKGFYYKDNYVIGDRTYDYTDISGKNDIATDTVSFNVGTLQNQDVIASPGEDVRFQISAYDELHNPVYSVPLASITFDENNSANKHKIGLENSYYIVQPNVNGSQHLQYTVPNLTYKHMTEDKVEMRAIVHFVDSYSSFLSNATISINLTKCRPGFVYNNGICVCDNSNKQIVRCDDELVYIEEEFWATYTNDQLIIQKCPRKFCKCNSNITKTGCAFNYKNPDLQCASNRYGVLCGKCIQGYGLNLMTYACVKCNGFAWSSLFLLLIASVVIIMAVLILMLNPHFSSHFRGILFFVQMLPYVCNPSGNIDGVLITISSWIDLGGLNSIPITTCFMESFDSLDAILLGYVYPTLIFIVLLILFLLHKFHMVNFRRNSPFQSSWILLVAMYKFLVETSLLLLFCVPYQDHYVFFYDGTVKCYQNYHLILTIIASIVLLVAVIPPPVLVLLIVFGHLSVGPVITDALSQGLRKHVRWWWSVDFLRRIVFISIYVFTSDWNLKQNGLTVVCILTLVLHMQMQPYRNKQANLGESLLLLCLTFLVTITETTSSGSAQNIIIYSVLITALLYCIIITFYLFVTFIIKLCRSRGYFQLEDDDADTDDEEVYNESYHRRIAAPSFREIKQHTPIINKKMQRETSSKHLRNVIVPSPSYIRSDLEDSENFNDEQDKDDFTQITVGAETKQESISNPN